MTNEEIEVRIDNILKGVIRLQIKPNFARYC